jgi:hypothetical protein
MLLLFIWILEVGVVGDGWGEWDADVGTDMLAKEGF